MNIKFLTFSFGFKDMVMKNTDNAPIKKAVITTAFCIQENYADNYIKPDGHWVNDRHWFVRILAQ